MVHGVLVARRRVVAVPNDMEANSAVSPKAMIVLPKKR
jgi:hypothetical protein